MSLHDEEMEVRAILNLGGQRALHWVVVGLFVGTLVAAGFVDTFYPTRRPVLVGEEKAAEEQMQRRARFWDGSWARLWERNLQLSSRVRSVAAPIWSYGLFYLFTDTQERFYAGEDRWLFWPVRVDLPERDDRRLAAEMAAVLGAMERRLAISGIEMIALPIPRKSVLYQDRLPLTVDPKRHLDYLLSAELERRGVQFVDLISVYRRFRSEHPEELLFFQADSHWTDVAQSIAAREVCRLLGRSEAADELILPGRWRMARQSADQLTYLGIKPWRRGMLWLGYREVRRLERPYPPPLTPQGPGGPPPIGLSGTSYTASRAFVPLLEACSGRRVLNAAKPGVPPLHGLDVLVSQGADPVVLEMPNDRVIGRWPLVKAGEAFGATQPSSTGSLLELYSWGKPMQMKLGDGEVERLALMLPAPIVHSGEGIVSVRLRGRPILGPIEIDVRNNEFRLTAQWEVGVDEFLLPLLSGRVSAGEIRIYVRGPGELEIDDMSLVGFLDAAEPIAREEPAVAETRDGWRLRADLPHVRIPRLAALHFILPPVDSELEYHEASVVSIELKDPELRSLASWTLERPETVGEVSVLLSLHAQRGSRLGTVEISGLGARPRLESVQILAP